LKRAYSLPLPSRGAAQARDGGNDPIGAIDDFLAPAPNPPREQSRGELYKEHCIEHKFIGL